MSACCVDHIVKIPRVFTPGADVGIHSVGAWVSDAVRAMDVVVVVVVVVSKGWSVGCGSRGAAVVADVCGICDDEVSAVDEAVGTADWLVDGPSVDVSAPGLH